MADENENEVGGRGDRVGKLVDFSAFEPAAEAVKAAADAIKAKADQIDVGQVNAVVGQALEIVTTINGFLAFLSKFIPKGK